MVDAVALMQQGALTREVLAGAGIDCWDALQERGLIEYGEDWPQVVQSYQRARAQRLTDRAQAVAEQTLPAFRGVTKDPDGGVTVTRQRKTDSTMIGQALAAIDPAVHGRGAGRDSTSIVVPVTVQIAVAPGLGGMAARVTAGQGGQ